MALEHSGGPVVLVLTRQGLPIIDRHKNAAASGLSQGAYILSEPAKPAQLILMATGSEVDLILRAQAELADEGIAARVVSMPSWELFEVQDEAYKEKILPKAMKKRLAVEMASPMGWRKYVTDEGEVLGMTCYGESAPAEDLYKEFGFTVDNVVMKAKALLNKGSIR
jgi:transketolase